MSRINVDRILEISIALSKEKDPDRLLELILNEALSITNCDAGTLYIKYGDKLKFQIMVTRSMNYSKGGNGEEIPLPPVQMNPKNVCSCAAIEHRLINLPDAYHAEEYDFSGPREYDALIGYKTKSMLVLPMEDDFGDVLGVLQLINAMDDEGNVIPFSKEYEKIMMALSSQVAIYIRKQKYEIEITKLFDSFVYVMSAAVDARSPYNANHTKNMVRLGKNFVNYLNEKQGDWTFSALEERQFLMSIWLHDIGKLVIPLEIMDKSTRLGSYLRCVKHRFEKMELLAELDFVKGKLTKEEYEQKLEELHNDLEFILHTDAIPFVDSKRAFHIQNIHKKRYLDKDGNWYPYLTFEETKCLMIPKGTLTAEERALMEQHVDITEYLLKRIHFTKQLEKVPVWAPAHHEFLDGSGYPKKKTAEEIDREVRIMTIFDIFEALIATDRPYKKPMSIEKAFCVLNEMVEEGKLDGDILRLFIESRAWEKNEEGDFI